MVGRMGELGFDLFYISLSPHCLTDFDKVYLQLDAWIKIKSGEK